MDAGLAIYAPTEQTNEQPKLVFTSRYPLQKLDSTKLAVNQNIDIFFSHEPPNPDGTVTKYQRNLIFQYKHGYDYATDIPSSWFLVSRINYAPTFGRNSGQLQSVFPYGPEGIYLTGGGSFPLISSAVFVATVDNQSVNFYIDKYYDAGSGFEAPTIAGSAIIVSARIYAEDLTGNSLA